MWLSFSGWGCTYLSGACDLLLTKLLVGPGYGQCPDPCRSRALWTQQCGESVLLPSQSQAIALLMYTGQFVFNSESLFVVCVIKLWSFTTAGLWGELQVPGSLAHSSSHTPSVVHISGLTWTFVEETLFELGLEGFWLVLLRYLVLVSQTSEWQVGSGNWKLGVLFDDDKMD